MTELERLFPVIETDLEIRDQILSLPSLMETPWPSRVRQLVLQMNYLFGKLKPNSISETGKLLMLWRKLPAKLVATLRAEKAEKHRTERYDLLCDHLLERSM